MFIGKKSPSYESYEEPNNPSFRLNPNGISEQDIVMTIPRFPKVDTPMKQLLWVLWV